MKLKQNTFFTFLLFLIFPFLTFAQTANKQAAVQVSGEVLSPLNLTVSSLNDFPKISLIRKDKDGKEHTFEGVLLADILKKAGVTLDKQLRGKNLTKYLVVGASDGYEVLFSLAELDGSFTDRKIMLSAQMDGKPLPIADGTFRIIVQDEKVPARCAKQVISLKVMFAK